MNRFAWLQFRTQTTIAFGALLVGAILLALTGPHLAHLYWTNVTTCASHGDCDVATSSFLRNDLQLQAWLSILVMAVPGILGIFWGAPLVARELEAGTFRLAWTQSVSRGRWLGAKLALGAAASMAVAGLFSLMVTWWSSPFDRISANLFDASVFSQRGVVPIGYAAFAFMVGVTAGVMIRRTLPAMAATLVAFLAVRLAFTQWIRPNLAAPAHRIVALDAGSMGFGSSNGGPMKLFPEPPNVANAWVYSTHIVDANGHPLSQTALHAACPTLDQLVEPPPPVASGKSVQAVGPAGVKDALHQCVTKLSATYHQVVTYQPAGRYWMFQWYELAIYLATALALAGLCYWWVRRRLS
jgi:hypothetical protein